MDGDHEISCKTDGKAIGLKSCSVKKAQAGQQFGGTCQSRAHFSMEKTGTTMAYAFSSSARPKSSEKSSSFFFAIAPSGIAGSFGPSAANVVAVTRQTRARRRVCMEKRLSQDD